MRTYLLVPIHTNEPGWRMATRRDPVQVIARNETEARVLASLHCGLPRKPATLQSPDDPWMQPRLSYARVLEKPDPVVPVIGIPGSAKVPWVMARARDIGSRKTK